MKKQTKMYKLRFLIIIPLVLAAVIPCHATTAPSTNVPDSAVRKMVMIDMPEFPGGEKELIKYISLNLKYPKEAELKGIQGDVLVDFLVNKLGKVENAKIVRGVEPEIDKEALGVVSSLPDFKPGEKDGKKIAVHLKLPIHFRLTTDSKSPVK